MLELNYSFIYLKKGMVFGAFTISVTSDMKTQCSYISQTVVVLTLRDGVPFILFTLFV